MPVIESKKIPAPARDFSRAGADLGFHLMREAFARAKRMHPHALCHSSYVLGGQPMETQIVGRRLAEFMNLPFAHLRTGDTHSLGPGLTIEIWDQAETNVSCQVGLTRDGLDLHPDLKRSADGRYASYQLQHSLVHLDRQTSSIVGYVSNTEDLSLYERGRPLHILLSLWLKSRDMPVIHAGLVSKNGRGVLLAGPGGSGKSTAAITCASAGFSYLSEDLVGLQVSDDIFLGHSLYSSTFIEPDHLERFALLGPHAITGKYPFEKKRLVLLSQNASLRFERACRIHALVLPRVMQGPKSRLRQASKGEALFTLAPSSLLVGDRSFGLEGFNKLAKLVEQVSCYWLELGSVLDEIPCLLEDLLSEVTDH